MPNQPRPQPTNNPAQGLFVPPELRRIGQAIALVGGRPVLVGGSVRNQLLGLKVDKDWDVEVFHLSLQVLKKSLKPFGLVHSVGRSFGVLKLITQLHEYDFSIPRKERNIGKGHKAFWVDCDPSMDFTSAAARRDFSINAIGYAFLEGSLLDPHQGQVHLTQRLLQHVGPAFGEDPLRVLRGVQFAGRFGFDLAPSTLAVCRQQDLSELPKERIWEEIRKLFLMAPQPSKGLRYMHAAGVLPYFPELQALYAGDVPSASHPPMQSQGASPTGAGLNPKRAPSAPWQQVSSIHSPDTHNPKQVPSAPWQQALRALDAMCLLLRQADLEACCQPTTNPARPNLPEHLDEDSWMGLCLSAWFHPLMPTTSTHRATAKRGQGDRHALASAPSKTHAPANTATITSLLERFTSQTNLLGWVPTWLSQWQSLEGFAQLDDHLAACCVRRLAQKDGCQRLAFLLAATHAAHQPNTPPVAALRLQRLAKQLKVWQQPLQPLLRGRHFLALGMPPSPALGEHVRNALQAQIEGHFSTAKEAQAWLVKHPPAL